MKAIKTKILIGISAFLIAITPIIGSTAFAGDPRDCDSNAVIRCGAFSKTELVSKINSSTELKRIFYSENRNITEAGIKSSTTGVVTKSGTVIVGGKTVASGVFSSGRSFMPGSTRDGSLWMRPPSVSFNSSSIEAFVIMDNGKFKSAILKSCGNPIKVLAAPFPQVFKRVQNQNSGVESAADTLDKAIKAKEGDKLVFTVTTTNRGNAAAEDVTLTDNLPAGLTLVKDPARRTISTNIGSVSAASRKSITITVTPDKGTAGKCIENIASMTAKGGFKDKDSAFVCVEKTVVKQQEQNIKIIKFEDIDHDGVQDSNEKRLSGFTFKLDDGTTKVSDSNGIVVFNNVSAGSHKIEEVNIPEGFIAIHKNPFNLNVASGQTVTEIFGNQKVVTKVKQEQNIKIIKFEDIDHDGIQDSNEKRLSGFTFKLDDGTTKVSDSNGIVIFNNVSAGSHKIEEVNIPEGFIAIHKNPFNLNVASGQTVTEIFGNQKVDVPTKVIKEVPEEEIQKEVEKAPVEELGKGQLPEALPEAGPEAVAGGILGTLALGLTGRNYLRSRRNLKDSVKHLKW